MPQDQQSGAKANHFGRTTVRQIMQKLGTAPLDPNSNECLWNGKRVVIKCARLATVVQGKHGANPQPRPRQRSRWHGAQEGVSGAEAVGGRWI